MDSPSTLERDRAQIFSDFSSMRFLYLKETSHNLSSKIVEIFKISISITPLLLGIGYYLLRIPSSSKHLFFFNISGVLFIVTILYGLIILIPPQIKLTDSLKFYNKHFDAEPSDILAQIAANLGMDCETLSKDLTRKALNLIILLGFFITTLFYIFLSYISLLY